MLIIVSVIYIDYTWFFSLEALEMTFCTADLSLLFLIAFFSVGQSKFHKLTSANIFEKNL